MRAGAKPIAEPPAGWGAFVGKVSSALGKLARVPLSAFRQASAATGYGLRRIPYAAEHHGIPSQVLSTLTRAAVALVDKKELRAAVPSLESPGSPSALATEHLQRRRCTAGCAAPWRRSCGGQVWPAAPGGPPCGALGSVSPEAPHLAG